MTLDITIVDLDLAEFVLVPRTFLNAVPHSHFPENTEIVGMRGYCQFTGDVKLKSKCRWIVNNFTYVSSRGEKLLALA